MVPLPPTEVVNNGKSELDNKEIKTNIDTKTPKEIITTTNSRRSPNVSKQHHTDAAGQCFPICIKDSQVTQEPVSEVVAVRNGKKDKSSPFKWFLSLKRRASKSAIFSVLYKGRSSVCCLRSETLS